MEMELVNVNGWSQEKLDKEIVFAEGCTDLNDQRTFMWLAHLKQEEHRRVVEAMNKTLDTEKVKQAYLLVANALTSALNDANMEWDYERRLLCIAALNDAEKQAGIVAIAA